MEVPDVSRDNGSAAVAGQSYTLSATTHAAAEAARTAADPAPAVAAEIPCAGAAPVNSYPYELYLDRDRCVDLLLPILEGIQLNVCDVARSLARQPRFNGHGSHFYSVAQHSVAVSYMVPPHLARCGLLHDAAEALLGDTPRPLLRMLGVVSKGEWDLYRQQIESLVAALFEFPYPLPVEVRVADDACLAREAEELFGTGTAERWQLPARPATWWVPPVPPDDAKQMFFRRWVELA